MTTNRPRPTEVSCLFLDLDGTVRFGPDEMQGRFVQRAEDVQLFPEVIELLKSYKELKYRVFIITNQGGIEAKLISRYDALEALDRTKSLLTVDKACLIDQLYYCPHYLRDGKPHCFCRKPSIGMLVSASAYLRRLNNELINFSTSLVVGDRDEDKLMAQNANLNFMQADAWRRGEHLNTLNNL